MTSARSPGAYMKASITLGIWGGLAVLLASATGCAVNHYHLDGTTTDAATVGPIPGVLVPVPGPTRTSVLRPVKVDAPPTNRPGIVAVAYQNPAKGGGDPLPAAKGKFAPDPLPTPRPLKTGNTPSATPAGGLTLDQVINATLLADPKLRAGFESINQANADALTASLRPNPELFMDAQLLPLTRPFTVDRQGGPPQSDININYPIDWFLFGKRAAAMQAAGLGVKASEADYADLVRQRVQDAATAYYDVLEAKAIIELARQDVDNLKRVEAVTEKAVEGGGRPQVELSRIRLDRLKSEQVLREAENALVGATARLRAVMGRADADAAFEVAGTLDGIPPVEPLPVEEAFAVAQQNRPDIHALRWRVAQGKANVELERRKAYPAVTPQAGYTRQYQQKAIGFPDADSYMLGLTMTLPVFDRNQGNRAKAASITAQNQFQLQAGVVDLRAEVIQADQDLRTAAATSRAVASDQLQTAGQVREAITKAYEAGGRPLIDVLDAQRNYRETYRLFITSRANFGRASVRYSAAIGTQRTP